MPTRCQRRLVLVILLSSFVAPPSLRLVADDERPPAISPALRRMLNWLPENTETLVGTSSGVFTDATIDIGDETLSGSFRATEQSLAELDELSKGKYLMPLVGKRVKLTLAGARNYEWISSSMPTYRREGCKIVLFEEELGEAGGNWTKLLREDVREIRTIREREVFVFPAPRSMRPAFGASWSGKLGIYVLLLEPDKILCATSDKFLEEVLNRIDKPQVQQAMPDTLRDWKHVDTTAPYWMLRRNRKNSKIEGVTVQFTECESKITFLLAATTSATAIERSINDVFSTPGKKDDFPLTIGHPQNDLVVVSLPTTDISATKDIGNQSLFLFVYYIYCLEANGE